MKNEKKIKRKGKKIIISKGKVLERSNNTDIKLNIRWVEMINPNGFLCL